MGKIRLPSRYVIVRKDAGTIAIRGSSGRFKGRRGPGSNPTKTRPYLVPYHGPGDTTKARRAIRDIDLDQDGKVDIGGGEIYGRTIKVKSSRRAKGYERRV